MEAGPARSLPGRTLRRLRRSAIRRRLAQVDLVAAAGELAQRRFATAFGLPRERVPVLGTPRFDVILGGDAYRRVAGDDLRGRLGLQADQHVVLWLPTWREEGDAGWLPALDATELEGALAGTRAVLVVKAHPYADADVYRQRLPRSDRLRLLPESDVDVNALLRLADSLVSDYSSAIFDYSLLERPIHFFAPDTHTYRDGRGLYEPYERLSEGRHHAAWPPLLAAVADSARGLDAEGLQLMRRVAALAGNNGEPGSSERIAQAVARAVGLGLGA
jgi:CDP-glycerol glycerophosphotransferase (TagB/SpsB family)